MKYKSLLFLIVLLFNCKKDVAKTEAKPLFANEIIDKSIVVSGGEKFNNALIEFNFRDKYYVAKRTSGKYLLERIFKDSTSVVKDVLNNIGFTRFINGEASEVIKEKAETYTASVNSVHYFSVLPYGLNDKAVNKELIGEELINNQDYFKIKVTFDQNGGGEDYDDIFIYWINKDSFRPDYLAYSYHEEDGKGMRFREAYNERYINGLRFVDYNNYKSENLKVKLEDLAKALDDNQLKLLSKIELENIEVQLIDL
ncbi:DUF6503 family protein [Winogradskyella sp.]|uniref:DUF6503 family protein n=1 Tax=Winogradskyella sp. TaxID=1883156 RepID=UPI0025DED446|nr:DUF6503 family protein [Winogradskyella sp.]MBT8245062.1 deoxyribose-phosphate aldolase [Winogradskyella sp.]